MVPPSDSSGIAQTSSFTSVLDELSSLLNTDTRTLKDQLTSGTNLADLLNNAGISMSTLAGVLQNGLLLDTSC
jgi:hypothetical protein